MAWSADHPDSGEMLRAYCTISSTLENFSMVDPQMGNTKQNFAQFGN